MINPCADESLRPCQETVPEGVNRRGKEVLVRGLIHGVRHRRTLPYRNPSLQPRSASWRAETVNVKLQRPHVCTQ